MNRAQAEDKAVKLASELLVAAQDEDLIEVEAILVELNQHLEDMNDGKFTKH